MVESGIRLCEGVPGGENWNAGLLMLRGRKVGAGDGGGEAVALSSDNRKAPVSNLSGAYLPSAIYAIFYMSQTAGD